MTTDRKVGFVCAVIALALMSVVLSIGGSLPRVVAAVLSLICIGCTLRALISLGRVQPDEDTGEMGDLRPGKYGSFSRMYFGVLGIIVAFGVALLFMIDELEEQGRLPEIRGEVFVIAFVFTAISVLKLPSWGYGLPFFSTIFVSALGFYLVYLFSSKSGAELN